jgi:hypothetical protein
LPRRSPLTSGQRRPQTGPVTAFIAKPFDLDALLAQVDQTLTAVV